MYDYIGIDPGKNGAVALLHEGRLSLHAMGELPDLISGILDRARYPKIAIEKVGSSPVMSPESAFSFGASFGWIMGCLAFAGFEDEAELILPNTWKRHFGLIGGRKDAAIELARVFYPFAGIKSHDQADAALIARYFKQSHEAKHAGA